MRFSFKKLSILTCMLVIVLGISGCMSQREHIEELTAKAEKGDVNAMLTLGEIYYGAQNTDWNEALGAKWMKMAAEGGHPRAQWNMGVAYSRGYGVPVDMVQAHVFSYKALCGGYSPAEKSIKEIEPLMSQRELKQAKDQEQQLPCAKK